MPHYAKHRQKGFTIQEMLIVVLITVILLAISLIGIVTYSKHLRITELDNSAKSIFMSAQNRAILLSSSHRLEEYVIGADNQMEDVAVFPDSGNTSKMTAYYIHSDDLKSGKSELLPKDTIDPQLWDGDFYIIYEPKSSSVVDVFFNKRKLPVEDDFPSFYKKWRVQPRKIRMKSRPMIGYYGGESAKGGDTISLRTPVIEISNTNTLTATVKYWVPRSLAMNGGIDKVVLDVKLNYQDTEFILSNSDAVTTEEPEVSYLGYTYTWTLDSLQDDKYRFHRLFSDPTKRFVYGKDFEIDAGVSYKGALDGIQINSARKTATDNSLFAKGSGDDIAYIGYLRHLQNLDTVFSHVDEKTSAKQLNDIYSIEGYKFRPISNIVLRSYDGVTFAIHDLQIGDRINDTTVEGITHSVGLFGTFSGMVDVGKELKNIRLVNTNVSMTTPQGAAGVLLGEGEHVDLTNCQVYWENKSDQTNDLQDVLGNTTKGLNYQVNGTGITGGLAGKLTNAAVTDCSASTLVKASGTIGGLLGQASSVTITGSYADAYLEGSVAAGLIGNAMGHTSIANSYAVGFINSPKGSGKRASAAGLSMGTEKVKVSKSYSAMLFTAGDHVSNFPLCQSGGDYDHTYYLGSSSFHFPEQDRQWEKSYGDLTDPAKWNELFGQKVFTVKGAAGSHPYNLQTAMSLNTFIYPSLEKLDHWGDWGERFQDGSLVYYECYKEKDTDTLYYGFSGGGVNHLLNDKPIIKDGYAVAYRAPLLGNDMKLTVTYETAAGKEKTENLVYEKDTDHPIYDVGDVVNDAGETSSYYLLPLPAEVVNVKYAAKHFYQKVTIAETEGKDQDKPRQYYYSPHFANTTLPYEDNLNLEKLSNQLKVQVRTPRHLYMLSCFPEYYTSDHQYRFQQQRDLIYSVYTGYDLFTGDKWTQAPIGLDQKRPFRGSYYGNEYIIHGVYMKATDEKNKLYQYMGLFGYSTSVLRDVVYRMDFPKPENGEKPFTFSINQQGSSSDIIYAGGLVGYNGGTVENCAVAAARFQANCYNYSTVYLGGLVGLNKGRIHASSVDVEHLKADASMSHVYAGGFVGRNGAGATIDQCYTVGRVSVARARYGNVYACGFAGRNEAALSRSYAAVDLAVEGGATMVGFCPDPTTKSVYLNAGNFTYRNKHFPAQYMDTHAKPVTWEQLTGNDPVPSADVDALGMSKQIGSADHADKRYPYPGIVQGASKAIHHGEWPDRMKLGAMGVYYWEKLNDFYYFSVLSQENGLVTHSSTLPIAHGDDRIVDTYGYGFFHQAGTPRPTVNIENIFWGGQLFDPNVVHQSNNDAKADEMLSELMGGRYTFHSYQTSKSDYLGSETGADKKDGLYLQGTYGEGSPAGLWKLIQTDGSVFQARVNPFFADSMEPVGQETVLGTEKKPYQVRSIEQLQFINWNDDTKNTNTVLRQENANQFPYLASSESAGKRQFRWEQTHDLKGREGRVYTPIAEFYDPTKKNQGALYGWFEGTYSGNDYMMADINISGQISSCVGLFGVVYNGTLQNIVLHSTDGKATVQGKNSGESIWYAIGGLAGVAGSREKSAVVNCTVTGYTIKDIHQSPSGGGWGGTGLGGLIGVSNMDLTGCTAVTDIFLNSRDNDNVRVGGLVGSCQGEISSCYTGGEITVHKDSTAAAKRGIYVGSIVGGIYTKQIEVQGTDDTIGQTGQQLQNTLKNCYTYMILPQAGSNRFLRGLYAVGGSGEISINRQEDPDNHKNNDHGWTNYDNNYYLASVVMQNNPDYLESFKSTFKHIRTDIWTEKQKFKNSGVLELDTKKVVGMRHAEMADKTTAQGLLQRLNQNGGGFGTVTTTTKDGAPISGRYSFGVHLSLLGKNYPFPTILTQTSEVASGGRANVHYGDWPLSGIRREYGALPVNFDLFADYKTADKGAVWEETLTLSGIADHSGSWSVSYQDKPEDGRSNPVVEAEILSGTSNESRKLRLTAKREGSTVVTVVYQIGDEKYELSIEVTVTAELRVAPKSKSPIVVYTDLSALENWGAIAGQKILPTAQIPMELRDKNNRPVLSEIPIVFSTLQIEIDPDYFSKAALVQDAQDQQNITLNATTGIKTGSTQMTAKYSFNYLNEVYDMTSTLILRVADHAKPLPEQSFVFKKDQTDTIVKEYTEESFFTALNDTDRPITDVRITAFEPIPAEFKKIAQAKWKTDDQGAPQVGTLQIETYPQETYPASVSVNVQFQFHTDAGPDSGFAGNRHTLWKTLTVKLEQQPDPVPPTPNPPVLPQPEPQPQPQPEEGQP